MFVFNLSENRLNHVQRLREIRRFLLSFMSWGNVLAGVIFIFLVSWVMNSVDPALSADNQTDSGNNGSNNGIPRTSPRDIAPASFIGPGDYVILVEKSTQKLYLYDGAYNLIKIYNVTTGKNTGDKRGQGDEKTPEGVYFFTTIKEDKELLPEYGVMALPINYPNFIDTISRKNGNGIWLHATNQPTRPLKPFDTRGCVVAANEDILEIARYIKLQTTPMIITDRIEYDTLETIEAARREINQFVETWRTRWEKKDIDKYMESYSRDFKANGMDWSGWKKYKDRLNRQYSYISVSLSDVRILRHNNHIIVSFVQLYKNNKLTSSGIKRLYLVHEDKGWKIIGEEWTSFPTQQPALVAKRYVAQAVNGVAKVETLPQQKSVESKVSVQKASLEIPQKESDVLAKNSQVDIEEFALDGEKTARKIHFKLVNKTGKQLKVSGRLAIIAENKDTSGVRYSSYPPMALEQGIPKDFRKGEWFSIRRFKMVKGEIEEKGINLVAVFIYSKTGELQLHKKFPVQTDQ